MDKTECNVRNQTIGNIGETHVLYQYLIDDNQLGVLQVHPFSFTDVGGFGNFLNSIKSDPDISFQLSGSHSSRLFEGTYHRFSQYYKGIEVMDGGFTILTNVDEIEGIIAPCPICPPIDPCIEVHLFSPYIYEDIDLSVSPSISIPNLATSLNISVDNIESAELKIFNNLSQNCEYRLTYLVEYHTPEVGDMLACVDANSGHVFYKKERHFHKNAPTADFGIKNMPDMEIGNKTSLQNDRVKCYDLTGNFYPYLGTPDITSFKNEDIPSSPININWNSSHADPEIFQLFWMSDAVVSEFQSKLGILFSNVKVGFHPSFENAVFNEGKKPNEGPEFVFGIVNGLSLVEYDIIGHEFGHSVIGQFISGKSKEAGSLHEGISDMFGTYIESLFQWNGIDWKMGDDIPYVQRDLENTMKNCYPEIKNLSSDHDRGEALGHWFFLCVNGSPANNILPMDILEILNLVLEALPNIGNNPDYPDLMKATLTLAAIRYGTCSDQFRTILRAWEQICVSTGHWMADPNADCYQITHNQTICEENNNFHFCLSYNSGFNINAGRWRIIGRNSSNFVSLKGMQGITQFGGHCLDIIHIPSMPYYPQVMTIQYYHPEIGGTILRRVLLLDCDGDDPTCQQYYNSIGRTAQGDIGALKPANGIAPFSDRNMPLNDPAIKVIIYDMMGRVVAVVDSNMLPIMNASQILVYTYWDKHGNLIESKRILPRN